MVWALVLFGSFLSLSRHVTRLLNRVPHGVLLQRDPSDCTTKGRQAERTAAGGLPTPRFAGAPG